MIIIGFADVVDVLESIASEVLPRSMSARKASKRPSVKAKHATNFAVAVALTALCVGPLRAELSDYELPREVVVGTRQIPTAPPRMEYRSPRELLAESLERLRSKGYNPETVAEQASSNLQFWREHPASWDRAFETDEG